MNIGIAVSTFPTSFGPLMFAGDLELKLSRIAEAGYDSLDLFIKSANEPGLSSTVEKIKGAGLRVSLVAAVSAFVDEGLYLSAIEENVRQKMIARMKGQIEFAASLNAKVPIGVLRGSQGGEAHLSCLAKSIVELYEFAAPLRVELLLEPINRYETRMINTIQQALKFIEMYALPPIKLLPDVFHMNIEEADMCSALELAGERIGHLHFADSNRSVPGKGHLPWDSLFSALASINYRGSCTIEAIPGAEPFIDASEGYIFVKKMLKKYSLVA